MRLLQTWVLLVAGCLLGCFSAAAQTTSTEILGTVTDSSGALVPGAKVTLVRVATDERRVTSTTSTGSYSFPLIEVGEYTVTVTKEGFATQEKTGVEVQLQQKARVNFELTVGTATQTVAVEASGVELKTDDAAVGQVIENKRIVELPLNGRSIGTLAVLAAGVQYDPKYGVTDTGTTGYPIPGRAVQLVANGQRGANQQITLDGVIATDPLNNAMIFTPSIDAIEEFKVQTGTYSAEYGTNNGALVQVSLKSGTNHIHGTFYEFFRNDHLDAADYFLNFQVPAGTPLSPKNPLRRNQFGAFLSGPVLLPKVYNGKDRTFWSFSYEGLRQYQGTVTQGYFFPQAFRNGDFSALLKPQIVDGKPIRAPIIIYDPTTGQPFTDGAGNITNIIPPSRINKNAQNFINQFEPLPQFQPPDILANNVQESVPFIVNSNQYYFRVDHEFRQQDRVFVRLAADRPSAVTGNINPNFPRLTVAPATNLATQYIHLFSPRTLNEFRYGVNKASPVYGNPRSNTNFNLNSLGIGNFLVSGTRPLMPDETGIPSTLIGGDTDNGGLNINHATEHEFSENLSLTRGSHGLKVGFDFRRLLTWQATSNNPRGILGSASAEGGYALAGFLMGYLDNSTTPEGLPPSALNQNRWAAYVTDDWKVSRRLTVNMGLRWDFFQVPLDALGGVRSLRLDVLSQASNGQMLPTLVPAPFTKNYPLTSSDNRYFMPRLGLAYRVTEKWIIRSGAGWFVNAQQLGNLAILARQPPNGGALSFNSVTNVAGMVPYSYAGQNYSLQTREFTPGTTILTLDNAFPGQGSLAPRTNLLILAPDNRFPNTWQWSFDIQRALPRKTLLTVAYVGSKSSNVDNTINSWNNPLPNPNTDINSMRPWQAYVSQGEGNVARGIGNLRYLDSYANGSYEGLQTTVEKHYSDGLLLNFNYVYSKSLGEGYERNSGQVNGGNYQNPQNRRAERARYPFDTTHNATISAVYEMPFLNRFRGVAGGFLAGWQVNGVITLHTGYPFGLAGGNLNTGAGTRPDRVADGRLGSQATRQLWFDPTAFRRTDCNIPGRPDLCHFGNAANDVLNTPGSRNLDASIYKNWKMKPLGEEARLQFRLEAFNTFNTPHFGQPIGIGFVSPDAVIPDAPQQGQIRSLLSPMRTAQVGVKLYF